MIIDLESLIGLPQELIERLKKLDKVFMQHRFIEKYEKDENIYSLIIDINNYCLENRIIGYHFTRAIENDIIEKGIIIRTGKEIRAEFIKRHFHLFTDKEQNQILEKWKERFGNKDTEHRDSHIFFNFTKDALHNGGAELLLNYYGGEQVYFPIFEIPQIGKKLRKIGTPMILKCTLNPNDINTFIEYPWGRIIISSYHRMINSNAHVVDQDGYQEIGVKPENIEIIKYKKHFSNTAYKQWRVW